MTDVTMRKPEVCQAAVGDVAEIVACLSALGYGTLPTLVAERLASCVRSPADAVFVASLRGGTSLPGVSSAHICLRCFMQPGRMTSPAVCDEARGNSAEEWAWYAGAQRMDVTSGDLRSDAHAFYQAAGYSLDDRRFIKHAAKA